MEVCNLQCSTIHYIPYKARPSDARVKLALVRCAKSLVRDNKWKHFLREIWLYIGLKNNGGVKSMETRYRSTEMRPGI